MSARTAVLAGRRLAESLMTDACTVKVGSGSTVNQSTGVSVPMYTSIYAGRCKVQSEALQAASPDVGGAPYTIQRMRVDFPVGAFVPAVGQVITVTRCALDANLIGRTFRVVSLLHKTAATAYRLGVEETT